MTVRDAATATAATAATAATRQERVATPRPPIIDCDVHNMPDSIKDLYPYLARRWRDQVETFGVRIPSGRAYSKLTRHRQDARPPSGRGPASEVGFMGEHYLDPHNVAYAILNAATEGASASDLELGAALATAANDWTLAEWLDPEPRLRASIMVAPEDPVAAAAEVRRPRRRPPLRSGAVHGGRPRADGAAQVLANLRGMRGERPTCGNARLRRLRPPHHRRRACFLLSRFPPQSRAVDVIAGSLPTAPRASASRACDTAGR